MTALLNDLQFEYLTVEKPVERLKEPSLVNPQGLLSKYCPTLRLKNNILSIEARDVPDISRDETLLKNTMVLGIQESCYPIATILVDRTNVYILMFKVVNAKNEHRCYYEVFKRNEFIDVLNCFFQFWCNPQNMTIVKYSHKARIFGYRLQLRKTGSRI